MNTNFILSQAVKIFEIFYYLIFCIVAVLTYLNAKKSFFSPFKNEVFKIQISEMSKLYRFFQLDNEINLFKNFGIQETKLINSIKLLDDFAIYKNWTTSNELGKRPYQGCSIVQFSSKYAEKYLLHPFEEGCGIKKEIIIKNWDDYEYGALSVSNLTTKRINELNSFINSPFLPNELKKEIKEFKTSIEYCTQKIGVLLTEFSKEVPKYIKNYSDLNMGLPYLENLINSKMKSLNKSFRV